MENFEAFLLVLSLLVLSVSIKARKLKRKERVIQEWDDLKDYLWDHSFDDDLTLWDWRKLLPVCRYADQRYRAVVGKMIDDSTEVILLRYLRDREKNKQGPEEALM